MIYENGTFYITFKCALNTFIVDQDFESLELVIWNIKLSFYLICFLNLSTADDILSLSGINTLHTGPRYIGYIYMYTLYTVYVHVHVYMYMYM